FDGTLRPERKRQHVVRGRQRLDGRSHVFPWAGNAGHENKRRSAAPLEHRNRSLDRKSTRLNSSHGSISYAVFCLKKKKNNTIKNKTSPPLEGRSERTWQ